MGLTATTYLGAIYVGTTPTTWTAPPLEWSGTRPGLSYVTTGTSVDKRKVTATATGEYAWSATPLFSFVLPSSGLTRVGVFIYDIVGDYSRSDWSYCVSGDTVSGSVHLNAGETAVFWVGDDEGATIGTYLLNGSVFRWPSNDGIYLGSIVIA